MGTDTIALSIRNATKAFGKNIAVNDVSFELKPGEVFGFLGPNGAGKSTMIKMIMGFLSMDKGSVTINGYDREKDYEKAMGCLGGIVENPEMYRDISGRTNLKMYARLHGNIPAERIDEVLRLVGMQDRAHEKVKKYSLGMKQRIGLAQAIIHKPTVLLLDEPTNGLDPAGIRELRDILKKLAHEDGVAVMVSSHILSEMQMMCDRVGIINKGKLLDIKLVEELKSLSSGSGTHRIGVSSPQKATEILSPDYPDRITNVTDSSLDIRVEKQEISHIIKLLVEGGVEVQAVIAIEGTLEDAYMQITGGGMTIE
ncbi:MAG: ABC transporter ATP-binding protein [Clostridiales bacterium]|nr:ABC transporter ATP-binding protein [Clostridiales bacterium]